MKQRCEICNKLEHCDNHHIYSLSKGGKNMLGNKCRLCPNCHRRVHMGEIIIEGRFATSDGIIPIWRKKGEESITGLSDPPVWIWSKKRAGESIAHCHGSQDDSSLGNPTASPHSFI